MAWPDKVQVAAFVACSRCCCLCHVFSGIKMELHHIVHVSEGGKEEFYNCIPLCFNCHADMKSYDHKHPKGAKYSRNELKGHRDSWYAKVAGSPSAIYGKMHLTVDRRLFREVVKLLPYNGSIAFVRDLNFAGWSFDLEGVNDLDKFENRGKDPLFEFIDADLEVARCTLASAISKFTYHIAFDTFPCKNSLKNEVPNEWEETQPKRFREAVDALEQSANAVILAYEKLMKLGRRKVAL